MLLRLTDINFTQREIQMTDDSVKIGSKCYIVFFANGGRWEDSWSTPIKVFRTEEEATRYKVCLEKSVPEFSEHLHKLMSRLDAISYRAAIKFADEGSEGFYKIYNSIYEPLRHKAELKYAGYTAWKDECDCFYTICEVEMESKPPECLEDLEDLKSLQEYVLRLKKENERLQKELSLLLLSQITENDQKLGLYE